MKIQQKNLTKVETQVLIHHMMRKKKSMCDIKHQDK